MPCWGFVPPDLKQLKVEQPESEMDRRTDTCRVQLAPLPGAVASGTPHRAAPRWLGLTARPAGRLH